MSNTTQGAIFAGGCFWCTEAIFQRLKGVIKVTSGYSGGAIDNPTYNQVSAGDTGHAECLQIEFDPNLIPYQTLLEVFFATHDSTTLNRQGSDTGTQYRSVVFYHDQKQKELAEQAKSQIPGSVTQILPFTHFYPAEDYHQNYYNQNQDKTYCQLVINPKLKKLQEKFGNLI